MSERFSWLMSERQDSLGAFQLLILVFYIFIAGRHLTRDVVSDSLVVRFLPTPFPSHCLFIFVDIVYVSLVASVKH